MWTKYLPMLLSSDEGIVVKFGNIPMKRIDDVNHSSERE